MFGIACKDSELYATNPQAALSRSKRKAPRKGSFRSAVAEPSALVIMQFLKSLGTALKDGLRTIPPTCRDATRLQSLALDQSLSLPKRVGLRLHLLLCKWCRRYGHQLRFLRQAAHDHPEQLANAAPRSLSL